MRVASIVVVLAAALAGGCGKEKRGEPTGPRVTADTPHEQRGEWVFHRLCYQCHPGGEAGLGPAINDKPLPETAIKTQIRQGVGAMPSFPEEMISDQDVDAIVEYLQEMRASE